MNWKKMLFPALAALAAVALGFFLPDLVGIAQHRMMSRGSDKISTQNMQLHFAGMDFIEKLETAVTGDTEIVMDTGTRLSREDAIVCAQETLMFFQETGFSDLDPSAPAVSFSAQAIYTVSYASLESFIQWRIIVRDQGRDMETCLLLDDETGMLLAFSHLPQNAVHTELSFLEIAEVWGALYADFAGLEFVDLYPSDTKVLVESSSDSAQSVDGYLDVSGLPQWDLEFRQQDDAAVRLIFLCGDGYYYFNI